MSKSWSRTTRYFVLALVLIGFIWFIAYARDLIGPLAISALLAYVLNPAVTFVNQRAKVKRKWGVLFVYLISLGAVIASVTMFAIIIPAQTISLMQELQTIIWQLESRLAVPISIFGFNIPLDILLAEPPGFSADFIRPDLIIGMLQAASTNLAWSLVILVTTYYLLQDWPRLRNWLISLAPGPYRADARQLYEEVREVWQRYLGGQLLLMFIVGLLTGLSMAAVGLPGAAAIGLLTGLLDIILSVGPAIAMAIAAFIAFFAGSTYLPISNSWFTLLVLAIFGLIQTLENLWLRPRVLGHRLRMHPAVVFVAVIGSLALAGVLTALIIVPLLSSISIVGRYVYAKIFDMEPWPEVEKVVEVETEQAAVLQGLETGD